VLNWFQKRKRRMETKLKSGDLVVVENRIGILLNRFDFSLNPFLYDPPARDVEWCWTIYWNSTPPMRYSYESGYKEESLLENIQCGIIDYYPCSTRLDEIP